MTAAARSGLRIRPFDEADTSAVIDLWTECGLVRPWNDPSNDIARKLQVQRELFLVGEDEGGLVASAMAGYDGHRGWVNYLAVAPRARRRGHARTLMAEVERLLLDRGCPKVNLQVREGNDEALGLYAALGYGRDASVSLGKRIIPDS